MSTKGSISELGWETGLYEENWVPLIRTLDTIAAVTDAVGG